ncbi:MAG TPA: D-alanyl-D-alanine carboxypeptidase/D-alanyl-D-alanine-endopeptidase [Verrucomicrobiae bacterium]|nr:D-alanyl-D-alanine carboxypeptidase/D-alanyl-D-alanine-endopeptidase [Verrucomicrobiae bacterium]
MRGFFAPTPAVPLRQRAIVRITPAPAPWTPVQIAALRRTLTGAFAPALSNRYSLAVIDATGRVIYANRERSPVRPASVAKLIVADAALNLLGPSYRFHTVMAAGHEPHDGTLDGNLWLVGSGDPSLRSEDLRSGVRLLTRDGVHRIDGAVAIDASAMSGPELNPLWDPSDDNEDFQVPTSAVSLDDGTAEFRVYGLSPGEPARVAVVPSSRDIRLTGAVRTATTDDSVIIAPQSPNLFALGGDIPADTEEKFWLPVHDMRTHVADVLQRMLHQAGITIAQPPQDSTAPLDTIVLWDHRSPPLRDLVRHMLFVSDNHYAEQLMRTLAVANDQAGTDANGLAIERTFLRSHGIPIDGLHSVDGSGLAEANRVSALTLAWILSDAQLRDRDTGLYLLLPAGGRDGTLTHYDFTTALGRVRAKTGHSSDASSLAGYVNTMHHGRVAFAFMINDSPGDPDSAFVSAVDALAAF